MFGASWNDGSGRSDLASDPSWARMFAWQKELIDWYGYEDLRHFTKEVGQEFAPSNAFQMGRLGMTLDGEWRIAFIAAEAPHLEFGTAPFPVDDARPDLYGSGYINGSVIGIPLEAGYVEESWKLVRYLATDDRALARLSNGLRNVPSTRTSLRSPDLLPDDRSSAVGLDADHSHRVRVPGAPLGLRRRMAGRPGLRSEGRPAPGRSGHGRTPPAGRPRTPASGAPRRVARPRAARPPLEQEIGNRGERLAGQTSRHDQRTTPDPARA